MQRRHLLALLGTSLLASTGHTQNNPSGPALPLGTAATRPQLPGLLAPQLQVSDSSGDAAQDDHLAQRRQA